MQKSSGRAAGTPIGLFADGMMNAYYRPTADFRAFRKTATHKWTGETSREWGRTIQMDPAVKQRVDALWADLGL